MSIFEAVKGRVTLREAAEMYGLKVERSNMACCPFHDDHHPSLKLNDHYFYCFGCLASGDVIDFARRLLGLSAYEAACRLARDFGIDIAAHPKHRQSMPRLPPDRQLKKDATEMADMLKVVIARYEQIRATYEPKTMDDDWHPLFVEAIDKIPILGSLREQLLYGTRDEKKFALEQCTELLLDTKAPNPTTPQKGDDELHEKEYVTEKEPVIRCLKIEPMKQAVEAELENNLAALQKAVDGWIEVVRPFDAPDIQDVALICNDEAKIIGLPPNRAVYDDHGNMIDLLAGTIYAVGTALSDDGEIFVSLNDKQIEGVMKEMGKPEMFFQIGNRLCSIPYNAPEKAEHKPREKAEAPKER